MASTQFNDDEFARAIREILEQFGKVPREFSNIARRQEAWQEKMLRLAATHTTTRGANHTLRKAASHVQNAGGAAEDVFRHFRGILEDVFAGAFVGEIIDSGMKLSKTYRQMLDVGQDFNGSMFGMAKAAADAAMPLDQFARMIERNSTVAAVMTTNGESGAAAFGQLQKKVRSVLKDYDYYGLTLAQISDLTGDYTETMRRQGFDVAHNSGVTAAATKAMAQDISDFSAVTGKSREEIAKTTNDALRDTSATSRTMLDFGGKLPRGMQQLTAFMASMPGEAGKLMGQFAVQTYGRGGAYLSDLGKKLQSVGMTGLMGLMDQAVAHAKTMGGFGIRAQQEWLQNVQNYDAQTRRTMLTFSSFGNETASEILGIEDQFKGLSVSGLKAAKERQKNLNTVTKFFEDMENMITEATGAFFSGFYDVLKTWDSQAGSILNDGTLTSLHTYLKGFGTAVAEIIPPVMRFVLGLGHAVSEWDKLWTSLFGQLGHVVTAIGVVAGAILAKRAIGHTIDRALGHAVRRVEIASPQTDIKAGVANIKGGLTEGAGARGLGTVSTRLMEVNAEICNIHCLSGKRGGLGEGGGGGGGGKGGKAGAVEEGKAGVATEKPAARKGLFARSRDRILGRPGAAAAKEIGAAEAAAAHGVAAAVEETMPLATNAAKRGLLGRLGGRVLGAGKSVMFRAAEMGPKGIAVGLTKGLLSGAVGTIASAAALALADPLINMAFKKKHDQDAAKAIANDSIIGGSMGASLGSLFFGVGAIPGAAIGAGAGALYGALTNLDLTVAGLHDMFTSKPPDQPSKDDGSATPKRMPMLGTPRPGSPDDPDTPQPASLAGAAVPVPPPPTEIEIKALHTEDDGLVKKIAELREATHHQFDTNQLEGLVKQLLAAQKEHIDLDKRIAAGNAQLLAKRNQLAAQAYSEAQTAGLGIGF